MNKEQYQYLNELISTEDKQLKKLNMIVAEAVKEQDLITASIAETKTEKLSLGQRLADSVAKFGGSWYFIICFSMALVAWIIINTIILTQNAYDPYPFILLNLILSCIAALQAPIIMMSQNRKEEKDRIRAENDYLVNLKAEIEIRNLHKKIDLLMIDQIKTLLDIQKVQLEMLHNIEKNQKK